MTSKHSSYRVLRTTERANVDGSLGEAAWTKAHLLPDLTLPWSSDELQATECRFLWDDTYLYGAFRVWDKDVVTRTDPAHQGKMAVVDHDRVEMFFALDRELNEYYCFEIDPKGLVLDYRAHYHRKFDFGWTLPGLRVGTSTQPDGYVVEVAIPFQPMKELGFPFSRSGFEWITGVYRADFSLLSTGELKMLWQAWVNPNVIEPDFHVPSSFGRFEFVNV
jgi:hypothetical protein